MPTELRIVTPETGEMEKQGGDMIRTVNALMITNDETFLKGGSLLTTIKNVSREVESAFSDPVKKAHEAHKSMVALRDRALAPFRSAELAIKGKLARYQSDQEEKRRREAEQLAVEARARAEDEKLKAAESAMDNGDLEKCSKILEAPAAPITITPTTLEAPKIAGVSFREDWDFEVEDVNAIPREYMTPDVTMIRKMVKAQGKVCRIPGIRIFSKQVVAAGR